MSDGSLVVFRGANSANPLARLPLVPMARPGDKPEEASKPRALWLSCIKDAQNPDIFRIERGQF